MSRIHDTEVIVTKESRNVIGYTVYFKTGKIGIITSLLCYRVSLFFYTQRNLNVCIIFIRSLPLRFLLSPLSFFIP